MFLKINNSKNINFFMKKPTVSCLYLKMFKNNNKKFFFFDVIIDIIEIHFLNKPTLKFFKNLEWQKNNTQPVYFSSDNESILSSYTELKQFVYNKTGSFELKSVLQNTPQNVKSSKDLLAATNRYF